ncbi:MAG TPA: S41 family peptidase [Vampirovibrionales bacterium]
MLKQSSRNLIYAIATLVLLAGIFGIGFYAGTNSEKAFVNSKVHAGEPVDLSPFWKVWYMLDEKFVAAGDPVDDQTKMYGAIQGMVNALGDPYTIFLPPSENESFNTNIQGSFSGVGMEVGLREGALTVIAPLKDSPSQKAGIMSGDVIIKIDETNTVGMTVEEAVQLIRGEQGTKVTISVLRKGLESPKDIEIIRDTIKIPTVDTKLRDDGVFVISLYSFNANANTEIRSALREFLLTKSDKLIFDLRGNPGGYLDSAVDISSWFLPAGKVIVREDFGPNEEEKVFRSKGYNIFNDNLKMVILVDGGSASASEIVSGALQEHGVAKLVGTQTFGKGSVQELVDVTDNTSLKVTIARWLTPNNTSISKNGLTPDIVVERTLEDFEAGIDAQMEAAVAELLK